MVYNVGDVVDVDPAIKCVIDGKEFPAPGVTVNFVETSTATGQITTTTTQVTDIA